MYLAGEAKFSRAGGSDCGPNARNSVFVAQKVVTIFSAFRLNPAFFALTDAHLHRVVRASDPCDWFRRKFNASQRRAS